MFSSQNNIILKIYSDNRTVFRLKDIAVLTGETNFQSLNKKLNYYIRTGKLENPRKGIYTKPGYIPEELACTVYIPSYISLEYVLQKSGVIFQFDSGITSISYLSRKIQVESQDYVFRKIKNEILINTNGILRRENHINTAIAERAFLDLLYLSPDYYFDNLNPLKKQIILKLLPIYQSNALTERVKKLLQK